MSEVLITGKKILITGLTGQVGKPVALAFAQDNDVYGLARFSNAEVKKELEENGITCVTFDLDKPDFKDVPSDIDYVLNFAVNFNSNFDNVITTVAEGLGLLMNHCRDAKKLFHCSTTSVYQSKGHEPLSETDPLGDNSPIGIPTYSICKIAAEAMARYAARQWNIPTVIARLNVPYGNNGGLPWIHMEIILQNLSIMVHNDKPSIFNPIHEDDIVETIPKLLEAASVPATIVNWAGTDRVSIEDWCNYICKLVGKEAEFNYTDQAITSCVTDTTKMEAITGKTKTDWKEGFRRMVEKWHPELDLT